MPLALPSEAAAANRYESDRTRELELRVVELVALFNSTDPTLGAMGRSGIADLLLGKPPAAPASAAVVGDPDDTGHAQWRPADSAASLRIHSGVSCRP